MCALTSALCTQQVTAVSTIDLQLEALCCIVLHVRVDADCVTQSCVGANTQGARFHGM
jgi:hypothetical protein